MSAHNFAAELLCLKYGDEQSGHFGHVKYHSSLEGASFHIDIPLTATDQIFYRIDNRRTYIANDLRSLCWQPITLDEHGLFSLFQFGALIPPWTIYSEIGRLVPGYKHIISLEDFSITSTLLSEWSDRPNASELPPLELQVESLKQTIDNVLIDCCRNVAPTILFSGGVDSGVLAARAANIGWQDTLLVNYSFGPNDKESKHAERMAQSLGLKFCRIEGKKGVPIEVLNNAGLIYRSPFGDISTGPTLRLSEGLIDRANCTSVIVDGTGADGSFGFFQKAERMRIIYRAPHLFRNFAGSIYKLTQSWESDKNFEWLFRILRRSSQFPILASTFAQNPLLGIGFHFDKDIVENVVNTLESWIRSTSPTGDSNGLVPLTDIAYVCTHLSAQKNKAVLENSGYEISYPFLDPSIVDMALQRVRLWQKGQRPKLLLKEILAAEVPSNMVYRPKASFTPPIEQIKDSLSSQQFVEDFETVISQASIVRDHIDYEVANSIRDRLSQGQSLSQQVYNFIWVMAFTYHWHEYVQQLNIRLPDTEVKPAKQIRSS